MQPEENNCYEFLSKNRIRQGDIIKNLNVTFFSEFNDEEYEHQPSFSYGVVLSQECDLEQHYSQRSTNDELPTDDQKHDKLIDVILICPAFPSEQFLLGSHIDGNKMSDFESPKGRQRALEKLKKNDELNRYHYLPASKDVIPELIIDFKRFYTIPIDFFTKNLDEVYKLSLKDLFKERLSQRFSNYFSRIGLPDNKQ